METKWIVIILIALLALLYVTFYNKIVQLKNRCQNALQNIDTQLQRRCDLIPNLVETVKGYAAHESKVFEAVTEARSRVTQAATTQDKLEADNQLTSTLKTLFAVAEAYPELKANENFKKLQTELSDTENRISYARQSYNDCVLFYNNAIMTFPGNIIAGMGKFTALQGFEAQAGAQDVPEVKF